MDGEERRLAVSGQATGFSTATANTPAKFKRAYYMKEAEQNQ
jgi:hypothetical protein